MTQPTSDSSLFGVTVMMVDDEPMMTDVILAYLEEAGYTNFVSVNDSSAAMGVARAERPGLMILDLMMPGVSGFDILEMLRADDDLRFTPVIVLTAASDALTKLRALELGATEFLTKPVDASELVLRVRNSLAFKVYQDRLANEDMLTRLPVRHAFEHGLNGVLVRALGTTEAVGVIEINVDRFKQINESLGRPAGDRLLQVIADRLRSCTRQEARAGAGTEASTNLLGRTGGDEFSLVIPNLSGPDAAENIARRVLAALREPVVLNGTEVFVSVSLGISMFPADGRDVETLLESAEAAMRHAKERGRNTYAFYAEELNRRSLDRLKLETDLRHAIERSELQLHFQPKVDLKTNRIVSAEALMRWKHPELGMVSPVRFIPLAEETGMIVELGSWAIDEACWQLAQWQAGGLDKLSLAVNVSRQQLASGTLVPHTLAALKRNGIGRNRLILEMTESIMMDHVDEVVAQLRQLREWGVAISIDDFGTGYSSLAYLKRFPVDELKLDRSFITGLPDDKTDSAIVRACVVLAHSLGLRVVAEGVESRIQRDALVALEADVYQGYLCSKPLAADEFEALVRIPVAMA